MPQNPWFDRRTAVVATMHKKEQVIAPPLEAKFGITVIVPPGFDSDAFGTFTRDIPRAGSQLEAARKKAEQVLSITGDGLAIASEGAFGPHPDLPFLPCDREIVLLLDRVHGFELVACEVSTETNYSQQTVKTVEDALDFAQRVKFPEHGLVVRTSPDSQHPDDIYKGIQDEASLIQAVDAILSKSSTGTAYLETDMRAMHNPTRMSVIERAVHRLIHLMEQLCPNCQSPGFDVVKQIPGLPCEVCHSPTSMIQADIYQCQQCRFQNKVSRRTHQQFADPTYCFYCNP